MSFFLGQFERRAGAMVAIITAVVYMVLFVAAAAAQQAPGTAHMVSGIRYHGQIYTEDCETAALQMALDHEGISVSQRKLVAAERVSVKPPVVAADGKVLRWGNPNTSFVGRPNASSIGRKYTAASGYGTYAPNIARVAGQFGGTVLWSGHGLTRKQLERSLDDGHPVVVWVGNRAGRMRWAPLATWTAWDGSQVQYPAPSSGVYEHTVLIAGWSARGVFIEDPLNGARSGSNINPVVGPGWVSWRSFLEGFRTFHNMAVVLR